MTPGSTIAFTAIRDMPEIGVGMNLAATIADRLELQGLTLLARDVLVVAQKVVSKSEGRLVELGSIVPSPEAVRLAQVTGKDPRLVEVILSETAEIVRAAPNVLIVRHRLGFVMANAGVDRSNISMGEDPAPGRERVLLLPRDPDLSAAELRRALMQRFAVPLAVIVSDSFGRPWRRGVTNVALGAAGLPALIDRRGERDRAGRTLEITEVALADAVAAGAALAMGEGAEGTPVVLVRGLNWSAPDRDGRALLRPPQEDLFR
jgi:coenzyme F420-0:L-glutamate ligase / coenzyme F420-1:gamma-L-glutamate ligase